MIPYKDALDKILPKDILNDSEMVPIDSSIGRVLAEDVCADVYMPPFDKSAMDGYACRYVDLGNELELLEEVPAGTVPAKSVGENQCSKIMTGAMVPEGADCVFMVEYSSVSSSGLVSFTGKSTKKNICYKGEDAQKGDVLVEKGTVIAVQHIPVLAACGCAEVLVVQKPRVSIIVTGSEVVEPSVIPPVGKIRNTNSSQLLAQLSAIGIKADYKGIAPDNVDDTAKSITNALKDSDILILTGGVSMGDYDLVPDILENAGFERLVDNVAIQPGKPMKVFSGNGKICFALSGNPVSSFIQFEIIVKPYLVALMGGDEIDRSIKLPIGFSYQRKKAQRVAFVPVFVSKKGVVEQIKYNGSAHIVSFAHANAVMEVPAGVVNIPEGEKVDVRQL